MFGGLPKKLKDWAEAGLITQDQSAQIIEHERTRKSGKLARDLTNLGLFAILLGFLSVIASNWQDIPAYGKLALHGILNLGVAGLILRYDPVLHPYKRDSAVIAFFALFLTFIALIAQIYQLHSELYQTLIFWLAICTPFIWYFGRTYVAIIPWLGALLITLFLTMIDLTAFKDSWLFFLLLIAIYMPLKLLIAARSKWLNAHKPDFCNAFNALGTFLPGLFASVATFTFNESDRVVGHYTLLLALMAIGLLATFFFFRPKKDEEYSFDLWAYLMISGLLTMLPFALPGITNPLLAAVLFILYWLYLAWLGARVSAPRLTDWAIRLIMLRLFILYLEVFGDLMAKGLGMILSGILLILLIKYSPKIIVLGRKLVRYEI